MEGGRAGDASRTARTGIGSAVIALQAPLGDMHAWSRKAEEHNLGVDEALLGVKLAQLSAKKADTGYRPTVAAYARLDHNATTPLDPAVREAMLPWFDARTRVAATSDAACVEDRSA